MQNVTTGIYLDIRTQKKDGTHSVKLQVTYNRKQKYYPLNISLTKEEFEKTQGTKPRGLHKDLQLKFQAAEQRARRIIGDLPFFTFESFEKQLKGNYKKNDVFSSYQRYMDQLSQEERVGTESNYSCSLNSLKKFYTKKELPFETITVDFLNKYERWMISEGNSLTTVGIYLRPLRALFNKAIKNKEVHQDLYPFDKDNYQIPAGKKSKKAIPITDIEKIFNYEPKNDGEARARDYWIFSYLINGVNMKDIAHLKYKNIHGDRINFIRAKTELTTKKDLKTIVAYLAPTASEIIERWGNKPAYSNSFVFPILTEGLSAKKEKSKINNATRDVNKYIKRIAAQVEIKTNLTTYTARHSYSTILKNSGVSVEYIAESLGHHNIKTTEGYLDSFEDETKKKHSEHLTAFKNKN